MIDAILNNNKDGICAEMVVSWGTMLDQTRTFAASNRWNGKQKKMVPSKSFTLGIYPKNLWWPE